MNDFMDEFRWCWFAIILGMFMYITLMVWGCVCQELAPAPAKASEGREEYVYNRTDVVVFDKEEETY